MPRSDARVRYDLALQARFWEKVDKGGPLPVDRPELGPCWIWTRALNKGYGVIRQGGRSGRNLQAHRVAYELVLGPIPGDLPLDHLCRRPACVNPRHLEPVTHRVNMLRGKTVAARNAAKTHCLNNHEFDEENTYYTKDGGRDCRRCGADYARARRPEPVPRPPKPVKPKRVRVPVERIAAALEAARLRGHPLVCGEGHRFTLDNTIAPPGRNEISCRECGRRSAREYLRRKKRIPADRFRIASR